MKKGQKIDYDIVMRRKIFKKFYKSPELLSPDFEKIERSIKFLFDFGDRVFFKKKIRKAIINGFDKAKDMLIKGHNYGINTLNMYEGLLTVKIKYTFYGFVIIISRYYFKHQNDTCFKYYTPLFTYEEVDYFKNKNKENKNGQAES